LAKKRNKKSSWLRNLLLYTCTFLFTPLIIWFLAFLLWFYWYDITGRPDNTSSAKASKEVVRPTQPSEESPQERIREEDRRKLEEILKSKK
jgi:cytoskeletal protein RodZ